MPIRPENRALYPADWKAISARIRFERAGGQCEWIVVGGGVSIRCVARHGEPHPITGSVVVLTTMHLDHDPTNCADDNLLAACQLHHLRYDLKHHQRNARISRRAKLASGDLFEQ